MIVIENMDQNVNLFFANFISVADTTPIVLYGLGKQSEKVLTQCKDERIIGVLDGFREDGFFCGKPILSLNKLIGQNVKIVIIARDASEKIIYKRIKSFCQENMIPVFNMKGVDLAVSKKEKSNLYFSKSKQGLIEVSRKYEAVSFDIFDTLLVRKIANREILYKIIGEIAGVPSRFAKARLSAEFELSVDGCPSLEKIYEKVQEKCKLSKATINRLIDAELQLETWNLTPRKDMLQVMQILIADGKKISLISDMYFSKTQLTRFLEACGVTGYHELFISCDCGMNKENGLFDIYKKTVKATSYLHIGDSNEADKVSAHKYGIDSYLIKSPSDMAELTCFGELSAHNESEEIVSNMAYAKLFCSPFALNGACGRVHFDDLYSIGYSILGPMVAGVTQWLIDKVYDGKIDKICFISRDGYLIKKVYELFVGQNDKLPKAIYLETSRQLNVVASLENVDDVNWAIKFPFAGKAEERLIKQFGIAKEVLLPAISVEDDEEYLKRHADIILQYAEQVRSNYIRYLNGFNLHKGKTGIFDFVSTGTCQLGLEKVLGFPLKGLYFDKVITDDTRKRNLDISAYVCDILPDVVMEQYFLLENWIKETKPSVKLITEHGDVIRGERKLQEKQVRDICDLQKGALAFCEDLMTLSKNRVPIDIKSWALKLITLFNDDNFCFDELQWPIYDEFTGRTIKI